MLGVFGDELGFQNLEGLAEFRVSFSVGGEAAEVGDEVFDHQGFLGLLGGDGVHEVHEGGFERGVIKLGGEVDAYSQLSLGELFAFGAPGDLDLVFS